MLDSALHYIVFSPLFLFALFFVWSKGKRIPIVLGAFVLLAIFLRHLTHHPSLEITLFGFGSLALFTLMAKYRNYWNASFEEVSAHADACLSELDVLRQKHHSRLEGLRHLEKQVAGLLDLFEIARDFGECLTTQSVADILYKKVLPELPFNEMRLIFFQKMADGQVSPASFIITQKGVQTELANFSPEDQRYLDQAKSTKEMMKEDDQWIFPLVMEEETALMIVQGAQQDDLAKFEVLSAYLVLQAKKVKLYETVKELAIRDGLTGVFVRRHFLERFEEELRRSDKFSLPLAVLMLDIDHFKRYNDEFGHLAGDGTLKQVASILLESLRKVDIVARYGGEEFVVVMPETRREGAQEAAERIRSNVARHNFKVYNESTRVTVSIGVALFPVDLPPAAALTPHSDTAFELIRHADKALYRAKEEGRNRVVLFQEL